MNQDRFEEIVMSSLNKLREDIADVKLDVANVKADITEDIANVKADITEDISNVKSDVAWVKGKLEGRAETRHVILTAISIFVAICAVVVAIFK